MYLHLDDPGAALFRDFFCEAETSSVRYDDNECDDDERSWVSHATKAAVRLHMPPASAGRDGWSAAIVRRVRYTHLGKHAAGAQRELAIEVEYADHTADEFVLPHDAADVRTLFYYSLEPARALGVPAIFSRNQWSQEFEFIWQQARCTLPAPIRSVATVSGRYMISFADQRYRMAIRAGVRMRRRRSSVWAVEPCRMEIGECVHSGGWAPCQGWRLRDRRLAQGAAAATATAVCDRIEWLCFDS